jgi:hypothetical protein
MVDTRRARRRVDARVRQRDEEDDGEWAGSVGPLFGALCTKAQCTVSLFIYFSVSVSFSFISLLFANR